jgi:antirestriction protein
VKFPVLAIHPKGFTQLFRDEAETKEVCIGFIGIYRKTKEELSFFDYDGVVWKLDWIEPLRPISLWLRILPTVRMTPAVITFHCVGAGSLEQMKEVFRNAVEADDDILTQHQEKEDILSKLSKAKSVKEVFRLYRWMMKDFRKGPRSQSS